MTECEFCKRERPLILFGEHQACYSCMIRLRDAAPELLAALKVLVVSTSALLVGLHDVLGIGPDDDDFPVAIQVTLDHAHLVIAMAENSKA